MEHDRQASPLDVKPSDLDTKGRPLAALTNIDINGALVQVCQYCVNTCLHTTVYPRCQGLLASGE